MSRTQQLFDAVAPGTGRRGRLFLAAMAATRGNTLPIRLDVEKIRPRPPAAKCHKVLSRSASRRAKSGALT